MLEHGGALNRAAEEYGIPLEQWLDLSTGINGRGWPVPQVPERCWNRLPEDDDGLLPAARAYYGAKLLLAVAGSQAAIQALPRLRPLCRVGVFAPAYAEHAHAWQQAGHRLVVLDGQAPDISACDVLIVVNPNNPSGRLFSVQQLQAWREELAGRGGWLLLDEAFIDAMGDAMGDATPEHSMLPQVGEPGLIVLRSLGKFFGLAGLRVGFVAAWPELLAQLRELLGPWPISHASRWLATQALEDKSWQVEARQALHNDSGRLATLLQYYGLTPSGGTALFQWVVVEQAEAWQQALARQGIWVRRFDAPPSLRFGLPAEEGQWQRLEAALQQTAEERRTDVA